MEQREKKENSLKMEKERGNTITELQDVSSF